MKNISSGWKIKAALHVIGKRPVIGGKGERYYVQFTTCKNKKQVTFLHNHLVQNHGDSTIKRHVKGKKT